MSAPEALRTLARTRARLWLLLLAAIAVLGGALAVALATMLPAFHFPNPGGPFGIGTLTYHWVDASRAEAFAADPKERRQLMVQIWYPAPPRLEPQPSERRAAYLPAADADAVIRAFARIHDKPAWIFAALKSVTTHAMPSVPVAADAGSYPVLLFLSGATGFRQMNTFQVEHLVARGYVVVAIDQPGVAAAVVFPDGHQVVGMGLAQLRASVGPSYLPGTTDRSPQAAWWPNGSALANKKLLAYLAADVTFTLDRLAALNLADPNGILAGRLDLQRLGAFGVSLGGIVVGETCRVDARLHACLMMDAPMSADVVAAGLRQPAMWLTRDAATMRLERQRAGGWPEAEIEAHQGTMRRVYEGLQGAGYFVRVPGMFHANFTDVARWTPLAPLLGLAGPLDAQRGHDIVNAYTLAFFDRHLSGRPAPLLEGPAAAYPEAVFESRRP